MVKRLSIVIASLCLGATSALGQNLPETTSLPRPTHTEKRLQFDHLTTREGLSQNLVFDAAQDKQGFMWFGTQDGLNRYDGKTIKTFDRVPFDPKSLLNSFVIKLHVGPTGRLWVGTGAGLQLYDPATESFEQFIVGWAEGKGVQHSHAGSNVEDAAGKDDRRDDIAADDGVANPSSTVRSEQDDRDYDENNKPREQEDSDDNVESPTRRPCVTCYGVSAILERANGDLWVGSGAGLARFDVDDRTEEVFLHDGSDDRSLTSSIVVSIYEDSYNDVWVATANGVNRLNRKDNSFERYLYDPDYSSAGLQNMSMGIPPDPHLRTNLATAFADDPTDPEMIWVSTLAGLVHLNKESGESTRYQPPIKSGDEDVFTDIVRDPNASNRYWLSTANAGLYQFDALSGEFENYRHDPFDPTSLSTNRLSSIFADQTGVLWIGTWSGGVNKLYTNATKFVEYSTTPGSTATLTANEVWAIFEDSRGLIWVGTNPGGVNVIDRSNNEVSNWTRDRGNGSIPRLESQWVFAINEDRSGTMWAGTYANGIYYRKAGWREFRPYPQQPPGNGRIWISDILVDRDGRVWILSSQSVNRIDESTGELITLQTGLGGFVYKIAQSDDGSFWVAVGGGGLVHLDNEGSLIERFQTSPDEPEGMRDNGLLTVHPSQTQAGIIWFGTADAGLGRLDTATKSFKFYDKDDGLANNIVYGILEDEKGMLWLSTNRGLSRFDPAEESFATFTVDDGTQSEEFNSNAYFRSPSTGEMFFGGVGGLNSFFPGDITPNTIPPQVAITGLRLFNKTVEPGPESPLAKNILVTDEVRLNHAQKMLTFEFVGLHFIDPDRNQYEYFLDGFNDDWVSAGTENTATFTNLDPGEYFFRVRAANSDGIWNDEGAAIRVVINPPWWRSTMAYLMYGLLLIVGFFTVDRVQRRRVAAKATSRMLETENQRKSDELEHAREVQLSLLPQRPPQLATIDIAAGMMTATEVGGDYYDFNVTDDGALVVAIGDATGHGLSAGTVVSATKGIFSLVANEPDIEVAMDRCARAVRRLGLRKLFMAFAIGRIVDGTLEMVGGGMPPALVYRSNTGIVEEISLKGLPLGSPLNGHYHKTVVPVESGDTILLMSDGFPELMDGSRHMLGYDRAKRELEQIGGGSAKEVLAHYNSLCDAWTNGSGLADDVTFVVLKLK